MKRILKYSRLSPCCFVVALIYLERTKRREPSICLTSTTFQRLLLIAVMEAAKFLDDYYESNKHWWAQTLKSQSSFSSLHARVRTVHTHSPRRAQIGGLSLGELNRLELEFLFRGGFDLFVTREEYDWCAAGLREMYAKTPSAASAAAAAGPAPGPDCPPPPVSASRVGPRDVGDAVDMEVEGAGW